MEVPHKQKTLGSSWTWWTYTDRAHKHTSAFEQEMIPWSLSGRLLARSRGVRGTDAWFLALMSARRSTWMPIKSGIQPVGSLQITFQVHPRPPPPPPPPTQQIHHHSQINYRRNYGQGCAPMTGAFSWGPASRWPSFICLSLPLLAWKPSHVTHTPQGLCSCQGHNLEGRYPCEVKTTNYPSVTLTTCFFNTLGTLAWELKLGSFV